MKPATEWAKHGPTFTQEQYLQRVEAIQLDAFKAGAEWAAARLSNLPNHYADYARITIKAASSNLKELPR